MLALAAVVVMAGSQLVETAAPRPTARTTTPAASPPCLDPEGRRNAPLGCALCLAVADWLNSSLARVHERRRRLAAAELPAVLADACSAGFEGYELWPPPLKEDSDNKLAKVREQAEHSSHPGPPGNWMDRLRKECRWYVQEAGEQELYRQWRGMLEFAPQRLDLFLCRNSGWLRACANLSEGELPSLHPPVVEAPCMSAVVASEAAKVATYSITRFRIICNRFVCWQF